MHVFKLYFGVSPCTQDFLGKKWGWSTTITSLVLNISPKMVNDSGVQRVLYLRVPCVSGVDVAPSTLGYLGLPGYWGFRVAQGTSIFRGIYNTEYLRVPWILNIPVVPSSPRVPCVSMVIIVLSSLGYLGFQDICSTDNPQRTM